MLLGQTFTPVLYRHMGAEEAYLEMALNYIDWLIYGARSPKSGAVESVLELARVPGLNHKVSVRSGIEEAQCADLLRSFFTQLRR